MEELGQRTGGRPCACGKEGQGEGGGCGESKEGKGNVVTEEVCVRVCVCVHAGLANATFGLPVCEGQLPHMLDYIVVQSKGLY